MGAAGSAAAPGAEQLRHRLELLAPVLNVPVWAGSFYPRFAAMADAGTKTLGECIQQITDAVVQDKTTVFGKHGHFFANKLVLYRSDDIGEGEYDFGRLRDVLEKIYEGNKETVKECAMLFWASSVEDYAEGADPARALAGAMEFFSRPAGSEPFDTLYFILTDILTDRLVPNALEIAYRLRQEKNVPLVGGIFQAYYGWDPEGRQDAPVFLDAAIERFFHPYNIDARRLAFAAILIVHGAVYSDLNAVIAAYNREYVANIEHLLRLVQHFVEEGGLDTSVGVTGRDDDTVYVGALPRRMWKWIGCRPLLAGNQPPTLQYAAVVQTLFPNFTAAARIGSDISILYETLAVRDIVRTPDMTWIAKQLLVEFIHPMYTVQLDGTLHERSAEEIAETWESPELAVPRLAVLVL